MKNRFLILFTILSCVTYAQDIVMQDGEVAACGGFFYDSGGINGDYGNDELLTLTICPDIPGAVVTLNFIEFNTQVNADILSIYDGGAGNIGLGSLFGTYSAANIPNFISAREVNGGCLTIVYESDDTGVTTGWEAEVGCIMPCQTILSQLDTALPPANDDGYIRVCPGEEITLTGSGDFEFDDTGATYEWDLGDGTTVAGQTATFSYDTPGIYIVNLNIRDGNTDIDSLGCPNTNLINQVVHVATAPSFSGTGTADTAICLGGTANIDGVVNSTPFAINCAPPVSGVTFLPDVPDDEIVAYTTCITVDCFDEGQLLTDPRQLLNVCLNMEHSWAGDLTISITAPNGQKVIFFDQKGGGFELGIYFGGADDINDNPVFPDDPALNLPGVGADYCFSMDGNVLLENANLIQAGIPLNNSYEPGTYLPEDSFNSLLGTPLNGDWCIEVVDNLGLDNGYIFSWGLEFDPTTLPAENSFTPTIISEGWDPDPSITGVTGSTITVSPPVSGVYCYTYRAVDDFGCEYTEEVCIEVTNDLSADATAATAVICGGEDAVFEITGTPNAFVNYTLNGGGIETIVLDATGSGVVTIAGATADQELTIIDMSIGTPDITGNAQIAIGSFNPNNAIGILDIEGATADATNSARITASQNLLTLILADNVPAGTAITISLARNNTTGTVVISDGVASETYDNTNTGAEDVLEYITFTTGNSTNTLTFTRTEGEFWIDGAAYLIEGNECRASIDDTATIVVEAVFDMSFTMTPTCDGGTANILGDIGGVFTFEDPQPLDGAVIDAVTGTITNGISNTTYTVLYKIADACNPGTLATVIPLSTGDSSFTLTPTCDGATAAITGDLGGLFTFVVVPTDGAVIDPNTGFITNGVQGTTYSVNYTVADVCPSISNVSVTVLAFEDPSFELTANCAEGATATITGDLGGVFEIVPDLGDGAIINTTTGELTGVPGTTYTVAYRTVGPCSETSLETVTVLPSEDASFTYTADCTGATATITGDLGGVFAFNPAPLDGALIDAVSGEITNVIPGSTYMVDYTTTGACSVTFNQTVVILLEDDSSFTLTPTCDGAIAAVTGLLGGSFSFNPDPLNGAVIDRVTGEVSGGPFDAIYTIDYTTDNGLCSSTTTQTVRSYTQPIVIPPTALEVCDDGVPDGITSIDLGLKNQEITGGNTNYRVSYHLTAQDAQDNVFPLGIPYTNTVNGQQVFARVEDLNTGCYATTTLELLVAQAPIANTPETLEYCDPDSDGFGEFDLSRLTAGITGGDINLTVSYHETSSDASNNVNSLSSPYNNIVEDVQRLYARVESATIATNCATILEFDIEVQPTPQLGVAPTALEVCDDLSADGIAQFDLTLKIDEILNNLADPSLYSVSFYTDAVNADAGTNAIAVPTSFTNTSLFSQELWVRVEDNASGCYKLTVLELIVNPLPVLVQPAPLELCDDTNSGDELEPFILEEASNTLLNGQTGISLSYYTSQLDADTDTNRISSPYTNTVNPQTIFVRATDDLTGCFVSTTATLLLRVNPIPSPTPPLDLEECDDDNDGIASFNLEDRSIAIIGGELNTVVTYHDTELDAETGDNALGSPYTNIVANTQTLYVRLTNTLTGCYNASERLVLRVLELPEVPVVIEDYVLCDTNLDGISQFDLSINDAFIIGTQTAVTLSYHVTALDALSGDNPIVNVTNYTNTSNPQRVYVRLLNDANGCIDTGDLELRVELPPEAVQPLPLELCDDGVADEFTVFDLTVKDNEITAGEGSWQVSYYETALDADMGINVLDGTSYTNRSVGLAPANPQTLYAVVTDTDTGCTDQVTLTIRVLPNPTPTGVLPDVILCDDTNPGDMQEVFDLTVNELELLNSEVGVSPTYHESLDAAENGFNAIVDPTMYANTSTPQEIFVRVSNDLTGCSTVVSFTILVDPLPDVIALDDFLVCDLFTDGTYDFDLSSKDTEVLNGQDPLLFEVTYHSSQEDADALINGLVSPYRNVTNPQQIFVAITNMDTGCSISTASFNIEVQESAEANSDLDPIVYEICDDEMDNDNDPSNNSSQFDLSLQNAAILDGQDPLGYSVSYYASALDADLGVSPLPFTYENIGNPQEIWARVDNEATACYAITALTLQVNPLPVFDLEDSYILCVNSNGTEVLDPLVLDTGLSTPLYSFEWFLNGTLIAGETQGSYSPTQEGAYSVTVTDTSAFLTTGCSSSDTTQVIESTPPIVIARVTSAAFSDFHVIEVSVEGIGEYEYSLDDGPWQDQAIFEDVSLGEHTVTARDINGCGEGSYKVIVLDYPKFFTPNSDTYNDTWHITGIDSQPNAKIYIFDRYGKLLKQLSPTGSGWDGIYNGNQLPSSDYWFTVEYNEPNTGAIKEFKAHFTLKL